MTEGPGKKWKTRRRERRVKRQVVPKNCCGEALGGTNSRVALHDILIDDVRTIAICIVFARA